MALSLFFATPTGRCSTNAPVLTDRIKFVAEAHGRASVRATIPHLDVQRSSGTCSTVAGLVDRIVLRAAALAACSTATLARLYGRVAESSAAAGLSNQFVGRSHRIVTPITTRLTLSDTYIESFSWTGMLGAGHVMEILDARGAVIARAVSQQASDSNFVNIPVGRVAENGYQVPTLDSGVLVITVGRVPKFAYGGR